MDCDSIDYTDDALMVALTGVDMLELREAGLLDSAGHKANERLINLDLEIRRILGKRDALHRMRKRDAINAALLLGAELAPLAQAFGQAMLAAHGRQAPRKNKPTPDEIRAIVPTMPGSTHTEKQAAAVEHFEKVERPVSLRTVKKHAPRKCS